MSPSSFEEGSFTSMRAIMEHSTHGDDQPGASTPLSGRAHVEPSDAPSRSLANTSASLLSAFDPNGYMYQAPPAPPQSVQSTTIPQSEPDLHFANDRLIENPRNTPASSIQGCSSINLNSIDKRLEALKLNQATSSSATSTEVLDFTSEHAAELSSSPTREMAARRRQSEMLSSDKPAQQSADGVLEHGDWKDEIISAVDHALARLSQLAHDDHVRNPSVSASSQFALHLAASLKRQQLPFPGNSELQNQLSELTKLSNEQVKVGQELATAINQIAKANHEQAMATHEQAKGINENAKTIAKLAIATSKE